MQHPPARAPAWRVCCPDTPPHPATAPPPAADAPRSLHCCTLCLGCWGPRLGTQVRIRVGCPGGVSGRRPPALCTHAPAPPPLPPHARERSPAWRGDAAVPVAGGGGGGGSRRGSSRRCRRQRRRGGGGRQEGVLTRRDCFVALLLPRPRACVAPPACNPSRSLAETPREIACTCSPPPQPRRKRSPRPPSNAAGGAAAFACRRQASLITCLASLRRPATLAASPWPLLRP